MRRPSKICALIGFSCFFVLPAQADETWSGFYAGLHVGRASSDFTNYDTAPTNPVPWWGVANYGSDADSFFGGGQAGYNFVAGNFLVGIEGEIGSGPLSGSVVDTISGGSEPMTSVDGNYYGTITGRVGVVLSSFLLYGKAGWGWVDADIRWSDPAYNAYASASETLDGAVYGGGVEFALSPRLTLKAEYLRFDIGDSTLLPVHGFCCNYTQVVEIEDIDTFKVGVNVKLGD